MERKECPLCGEMMRRQTRTVTDRIPGGGQSKPQNSTEWVCPECDSFEEAEES